MSTRTGLSYAALPWHCPLNHGSPCSRRGPQVYEGALYVEKQTAAAELRRLQAEGFFGQGDYSTDRLCAALAAANATRVLQLRLLRSITGRQFTDALSKSLEPRVAGTGDSLCLDNEMSP